MCLIQGEEEDFVFCYCSLNKESIKISFHKQICVQYTHINFKLNFDLNFVG